MPQRQRASARTTVLSRAVSVDPGPLHWLEGWAERLDNHLRDPELQPGHLDWMIFRPDAAARDALIGFAVRFPQVVAQVREFLDFTEARYADLCELLPPKGCPACGSDEFEDLDPRQIDPLYRRDVIGLSDAQVMAGGWLVRRCFYCDAGTKLRQPTETEVNRLHGAAANLVNSYFSLCRVIRVAVKEIGAVRGPALNETEEMILAVLADSGTPMSGQAIADAVRRRFGDDYGTFNAAFKATLSALRKSGRIGNDGKGRGAKGYTILDPGRAALKAE